MSNQDLINYQLAVEANNTQQIAQLTQQNVYLNQNIVQMQTQINNNNNNIATLEQDNVWIEETIAFIPSDNTK